VAATPSRRGRSKGNHLALPTWARLGRARCYRWRWPGASQRKGKRKPRTRDRHCAAESMALLNRLGWGEGMNECFSSRRRLPGVFL